MDTPTTTPALGDLLLAARTRSGLTQEELAERSGVSVRTISDLERHRIAVPQRRTAAALADALPLSETEWAALRGVRRRPPAVAPAGGAVAQHVPPDLADLTGRAAELDRLTAYADEAAAGTARTAPTVVLTGPPGVGKTTLAVRAAHELADRFPDGRIVLDLRGFDAQPMAPAETLALLLSILGVPAPQVPPSTEERAATFRGLVGDRAMLFVFDNAATEAQVRPLLVGSPRCLVLVTSRRALAGLSGARRLAIDELPAAEAVGLLGAIVGTDRVEAEPAASADVVTLCGNLPIALRVIGNRLLTRPQWTIASLAERLRDERRRLSVLTAGDLAVRPAFELSYDQLGDDARTLFRRLALMPGRSASAEQARYLLAAEPEPALDELLESSLLKPAPIPGRYEFHDLLRVFATERLHADDPAETVRALDVGVVDWLLHTAIAVGNAFEVSPASDAPVADLSLPDAKNWVETETDNWLGAMRRAAADGRHEPVADVAIAMWPVGGFVNADMMLWEDVFGLGLASARELDDPARVSHLLSQTGWLAAMVHRDHDRAYALFQEAMRYADPATAPTAASFARWGLGLVDLARDDNELAARRCADAIRIAESDPTRRLLGNLHGMRGTALRRLDDLPGALAEFERSVACARGTAGSGMGKSNLGYALTRLGTTLGLAGRWRHAVDTQREAVACLVAVDDGVALTWARLRLAQALHQIGDLDAARAELDAARQQADVLVGWPAEHHQFLAAVDAAFTEFNPDSAAPRPRRAG